MKRCLLCLSCILILLTGCTDIRTRLLPDILAVDSADIMQFAAHTSQNSEIVSAQADTALQMQDALRNASGSEISTGHLTMLAVSGNPCGILEDYFQAQILAPNCLVLSVPADACGLLRNSELPLPEKLQAAAETGMLPCRTADTVLADLWGGSGITAVYTLSANGLTLTLWSSEGCCGTVSDDACRGLALLGRQKQSFVFAADDIAYRLVSDTLRIQISQTDTLKIDISGTVTAEPAISESAAKRLTDMLTAALSETVTAYGADLLYLREHAIRSGISAARSCSQAEWRELLRSAECYVRLHTPFSRK